jgi:hypothetical protein
LVTVRHPPIRSRHHLPAIRPMLFPIKYGLATAKTKPVR